MERMIESLNISRLNAANLADEMVKNLNIYKGCAPVSGLNMLNSQCVLLIEILDQYKTIWDRLENASKKNKWLAMIQCHSQDKLVTENSERLNTVCKSAFILAMSSVEYCAKETAKTYYTKLLVPANTRNKHIYLSGIIETSHKEGLISEDIQQKWRALIQLRNCLVHNNGIANQDAEYVISTETTVRMTNGEMISGSLILFPHAISLLVDIYAEWANSIVIGSEYVPDLKELEQRTLTEEQRTSLSNLAAKHPNVKYLTIRQRSKESSFFSSEVEKHLEQGGWITEQLLTMAPREEQLPSVSLNEKHQSLRAFDELTQVMKSILPNINVGQHVDNSFDIVIDVGIVPSSPSQSIKDELGPSQIVLNPNNFF
ncbi:hypothetical protein CCL19_02900 [Pseudomonas syringae]|uniref:hypothetical protein n=1 Tax=Pseudomonas syringae TaxID=317 RepID=UPI000BB5BF62|nr:hypothetical protein [Pseudomonas syringae]PBP76930.1 hypothetical protein CCL19_02900 [Pseudomonas syringae]